MIQTRRTLGARNCRRTQKRRNPLAPLQGRENGIKRFGLGQILQNKAGLTLSAFRGWENGFQGISGVPVQDGKTQLEAGANTRFTRLRRSFWKSCVRFPNIRQDFLKIMRKLQIFNFIIAKIWAGIHI